MFVASVEPPGLDHVTCCAVVEDTLSSESLALNHVTALFTGAAELTVRDAEMISGLPFVNKAESLFFSVLFIIYYN